MVWYKSFLKRIGLLVCFAGLFVDAGFAEIKMNFGQIFGVGLRGSTIASGDLNGDGHPDLAVANMFSHSVSVAYNDGSGRFGQFEEIQLEQEKKHPVAVDIGDLDDDGRNDIVLAHIQKVGDSSEVPYDGAEIITIFFNEDGSLEQKAFGIWGVPSWVKVADINNNGVNDILVGNNGNLVLRPDFIGQTDGGIYPYLNLGNREFVGLSSQTIVGSIVHFVYSDFDDDGLKDVVGIDQGTLGLSGFSGELVIEDPKIDYFKGTSSGVEYDESKFILLENKPWSIDTGDFDGDGETDIIVAIVGDMDFVSFSGENAFVATYQFNGTRFSRSKIIPTPGVAFFVLAEDYDMDGDDDFAVTVQEIVETPDGNLQVPTLRIYENDGFGNFTEISSHELQEEPRYAVKDDFDDDGDTDIAVLCSINDVGGAANAYNGQVYTFFNDAITSVGNWELY